MNLEYFHTKALRLVKEAEYPEGATQDRILRDILISGLASGKICAKIIKEGKDVTFARVMEITKLEVSMQKHIDRMQDTAKVNYVQYGKGSKKGKSKSCEVAFQHCKEEISKNFTLPYFNPKASTILQIDASKKGLGAVILQNSKPVMFASRALTGSERDYQNLERESALQPFGSWKNSTTSYMERNLPWKWIRSH